MKARLLLLVGGAVLLGGCVVTTSPMGPTQYESPSFERGDAKELHLTLRMGAGDLKVGTGTRKMMQAYFTYNVADWKPVTQYTVAGGIGNLTISQPDTHHVRLGNHKYEWDLRLAQDIPIDLNANFGAGKATLDLGSLTMSGVNVEMGVGSLDMDLRGSPKRDYNVQVHGGVGEAIIHLPSNVGVYAEASGGIGEIQVHNLRKEEGHWVNDAYATSPVKIHLNVEGGVGSIRLLGD